MRFSSLATLLLLVPLTYTAASQANAPQAAASPGLLPPAEQLPRLLMGRRLSRQACAPQAPLEARLDVDRLPQAGRSVRLVFSVLPLEPMRNPQLRWGLPAGVRATDQAQPITGPVKAGVVTQFSRQLVFPGPGDWPVSASLLEAAEGRTWGRQSKLWVRISRNGHAQLSLRAFGSSASPNHTTRPRLPGEAVAPVLGKVDANALPPKKEPAVRKAVSTLDAGSLIIKGKLTYRHHDGQLHGALGTTAELWDRDGFGGTFLASVICDAEGRFQFPPQKNTDGFLDGSGLDPYIVWWSENGAVDVMRPGFGGDTFSLQYDLAENLASDTYDVGERVVDHGAPGTDDGTEGAYELVDTLSRGYVHYYSLGYDMFPVDCVWEPGYDPNNNQAAYYEGLLGRITLTDGQHYDESVVLHEYGHHVEQCLKQWWMPGGAHNWFGHTNDRLAFSEGWASYSGQSTLGHPRYLDTPGPNGGGLLDVDMERQTGTSPGATTEASVCASLWDLYDDRPGDPQPHDFVSEGAFGVVRVFAEGGAVDTIGDFRTAWLASGRTDQIHGVYRDHNIDAFVKAPSQMETADHAAIPGEQVTLSFKLWRTTDLEGIPNVSVNVTGTVTRTVTTDAQGRASFPYTVPLTAAAGTLSFSFNFPGDTTYTASGTAASIQVTPPANTTLALSLPEATVGDPAAKWSAVLKTTAGKPIPGKKIRFYVGGTLAGGADTNKNGVATLSYRTDRAGSFSVEARFAGDRENNPRTVSAYGLIKKAATKSTLKEVPSVKRGGKVQFRAAVKRSPAGVAIGKLSEDRVEVEFFVGGTSVGKGKVNSTGEAVCSYTVPVTSTTGKREIKARFPGSPNYLESTALGSLTVTR